MLKEVAEAIIVPCKMASYVVRVVIMMQRSNVILIALKVQNSFKQSFGAKVQRRSVQSRSDLQSKRRVERLYWRLLPGSDKVVVSYCWAELGPQMVMVKIRNDGGCMIVVPLCNCVVVVQLCDQWPGIKLLVAATSAATHFQIRHNLLQRDSYFARCVNFFFFFPGFHRRENTSKVVIRFSPVDVRLS